VGASTETIRNISLVRKVTTRHDCYEVTTSWRYRNECIIRPHRSTAYVDAAYCYRPSIAWSVGQSVCRSICRSVSLSVTLVSPAKTAAPIEMPFGLRTRVGPANHVLHLGPDPPMMMGHFEGERGVPL